MVHIKKSIIEVNEIQSHDFYNVIDHVSERAKKKEI